MKEVNFDTRISALNPEVQSPLNERFKAWLSATFWIFNALYALAITLIAGPMLLEPLWQSVSLGNAPAHQIVVIVAAMLLPGIAVGFVLYKRLHTDHTRLGEFLIGVELPLAGVLLGRSLWAHQLTATAISLYAFMLTIAICQGWLLSRRKVAGIPIYRPHSPAMTAVSALVATGGVYLSTLAVIFTAPVTAMMLFGSGVLIIGGIAYMFTQPLAFMAIPLGFLLLGFGTFAVWLSFYTPYCYVAQWHARIRRTESIVHKVISATVVVACISLFVAIHVYAKSPSLSLLNKDQSSESVQASLLRSQDELRADLVDAYLSPLRYLPNDFGVATRQPLLEFRNYLLKLLLPTLVYQGDTRTDMQLAERQYEAFFDQPIQRAERRTILNAHRNHWTPNSDLSAGLLDIGQRTVHVESQNVTVDVKQNVSTITIQEVLQNRTPRALETLQYFTLPEDAVITGLWLSDNEAHPEMFPFQVAPRGAAQQVYREQVQIRVDPALLELVGPRQYRLRVFPVVPDTPMIVTLKYRTLQSSDGQWPLPVLKEQRNIFWDKNTRRSINGQPVKQNTPSAWLPDHLGKDFTDVDPQSSLSFLDGGNIYHAKPLSDAEGLHSNARIAVLIDGSYSMDEHRAAVRQALNKLPEADIFFCKDSCSAIEHDAQSEQIHYGNTQPLQQLSAFKSISGKNQYDAILMLSDGGSYEIELEEVAPELSSPTWIIELGNGAHAYRDNLIDTIRASGGDIVLSVEQALSLILTQDKTNNHQSENGTPIAVTERHIWFEREAKNDDAHNSELSEIVAGLKIKQASQSGHSVESLDELHQIALEHGIVSNYSSMIVLVNDAQRDRLKNLSNQKNRFDREVETGKSVVATAVPEPHEWALLALAFLLLLHTAYKQGWTIAWLRKRFEDFISPQPATA